MRVEDFKRLVGKTVNVHLPRHFQEDIPMRLLGYAIRLKKGDRGDELIRQLIVADRSGTEYYVRMEDVYEQVQQ